MEQEEARKKLEEENTQLRRKQLLLKSPLYSDFTTSQKSSLQWF